jgi:hypothetical protein
MNRIRFGKLDRRTWFVIIAVSALMGIVAGIDQWRSDGESPFPRSGERTTREEPPPITSPPTSPRPTPDPRPPMTSRVAHPFVTLLNRWDRLYASIMQIPSISHGETDHVLHQQMRDVLTPDSPLWPAAIDIAGARQPSAYASPDVVLTAGSIPAHLLEPGERNATWPLVHEVLGDLPSPNTSSDTARARACIHMDFRIDRPNRWLETAVDGRLQVIVTFRRVNGQWRLHTWEWEEPVRGCQRCGPEPATVANHAAFLSDPRPDGGPGLLQPQNDPPCAPDPRR